MLGGWGGLCVSVHVHVSLWAWVHEDKKEILTISLQLLVCSTQFSLGVEVGDYVCFTLTLGLGEIFRYLCSN